MKIESVPTRGRTLDHAAFVYDFFEPILLLGKQAEYDRHIVSLLELKTEDRVLDLGCGTGVLTRMIADKLDAKAGGVSLGIDAAAKMIRVARKKRESETCRFEVAAAEDLPFETAGEVQRISVARAMAHSPQMLLADEPTASLDTDTGRDLVQLMFNMGREHGCTMIIATHDQEIINLADAFLPLRDGRIEKEDG